MGGSIDSYERLARVTACVLVRSPGTSRRPQRGRRARVGCTPTIPYTSSPLRSNGLLPWLFLFLISGQAMPTHHCMRLRALLCLRPQLPLPPSFIEKRSPNPSLRATCKTYARVAGSPATVHAPHILFTDFVGFFYGFFFGHNHTPASLSQRGVPRVSLRRWFLGSTGNHE